MTSGPLTGVRVVEMAALGGVPFCGMVLSDLGADVVRVDRAADVGTDALPYLGRGRRSVALDLKHADGLATLLRLIDAADVLLEGFRPGVAERLGFGPDACHARNPRLVYTRVTGWGQDGPLRLAAGHDINYIAIAGVLGALGPAGQPPVPPLNLVGDFGGGGMLAAVGVLAALLQRATSGVGEVVDAAMVDGALLQMYTVFEMVHRGAWPGERGHNSLDGGAPFYRTYETKDHRYVAFGAIEDQFYARFAAAVGLTDAGAPSQWDRAAWPAMVERVAAVIATRTQAEWDELLGSDPDLCFTTVASPQDAPAHPHHEARGAFSVVDGWQQPAPAPRFVGNPGQVRRGAPRPGAHTREALAEWGFDVADVDALLADGAARHAAD